MASPPYKLSCALYGHTLDVRSVAVTPEGCIVSGSRDKTAKVWKPNGINTGYSDAETLLGHTNFVSAVCYIPPDDVNRNGLVLTGSNDTAICVFDPVAAKLIMKLQGHTSNVCCLSAGAVQGTALSGSWDTTAKYWRLDGSTKPVAKLIGHQAAVWSVIQLSSGTIVTASADKSLRVWSKVGDCLITFDGHTDCVRGLSATSDCTFLSASNDATIRHWNAATGVCLNTFYGHTNYIYCVCAMPGAGADCFVSSGEDRTIRVWQSGDCQQVLTLPAQSVWSVAYLPNGDIVAGSSDGMIRVFSADPSRHADPALLQQYDEEVNAVLAAQQKDLGGINVDQLPGSEALSEPGKKDGQTKMIRTDNGVICYSWSEESHEWAKIGDVVGSSGGKEASPGKTLYEGKEYDYVFNVDIEEGKPPLRLPYNTGDDPWSASQKFIHDNDLSQMFLEQVANFIVANSAKTDVKPASPSAFGDPLTGGNRYIPGNSTVGAPGADPFTGANRYVPPGTASNVPAVSSSSSFPEDKPYFPQHAYLTFDVADLQKILEKLQEFNGKVQPGVFKAQDSQLVGVCQLANPDSNINSEHIAVLKQLLQWPPDLVLPVLDVTRLAVRSAQVNKELCTGVAGEELFEILRQCMRQADMLANVMMALRVVTNMMRHPAGEALALRHCEYFLSTLKDYSPEQPTKNMQVAMVTLLINLAVGLKRTGTDEPRSTAALVTAEVLTRLSDQEALFRGLVAFGTLVWDSESASEQELLKTNVKTSTKLHGLLDQMAGKFMAANTNTKEGKAANCAVQVLSLLQI